jgi:hypothetical protein
MSNAGMLKAAMVAVDRTALRRFSTMADNPRGRLGAEGGPSLGRISAALRDGSAEEHFCLLPYFELNLPAESKTRAGRDQGRGTPCQLN